MGDVHVLEYQVLFWARALLLQHRLHSVPLDVPCCIVCVPCRTVTFLEWAYGVTVKASIGQLTLLGFNSIQFWARGGLLGLAASGNLLFSIAGSLLYFSIP